MKFLLVISCAVLCASCATRPHTYTPPNAAKLEASTGRVARAVTAAHGNAKKAQAAVDDAVARARAVAEEAAKIKDVPTEFTQHIAELEMKLAEAKLAQRELDENLMEAQAAKAQVEKDKVEYFASAQQLADKATAEREQRIKAEKTLHWYRFRWWGAWIVGGIGVLVCIILALLKLTGRLAL